MSSGDISVDALDRVDAARVTMEQLDSLYNQALDKLEVCDAYSQRACAFNCIHDCSVDSLVTTPA